MKSSWVPALTRAPGRIVMSDLVSILMVVAAFAGGILVLSVVDRLR